MVNLGHPSGEGFVTIDVWRSEDAFHSWWNDVMEPALAEVGLAASRAGRVAPPHRPITSRGALTPSGGGVGPAPCGCALRTFPHHVQVNAPSDPVDSAPTGELPDPPAVYIGTPEDASMP